jgi:hypothetical protein
LIPSKKPTAENDDGLVSKDSRGNCPNFEPQPDCIARFVDAFNGSIEPELERLAAIVTPSNDS